MNRTGHDNCKDPDSIRCATWALAPHLDRIRALMKVGDNRPNCGSWIHEFNDDDMRAIDAWFCRLPKPLQPPSEIIQDLLRRDQQRGDACYRMSELLL